MKTVLHVVMRVLNELLPSADYSVLSSYAFSMYCV